MSRADESASSQPKNLDEIPGHRLLARMGKQALRPGGRELTDRLIKEVGIRPADHVVELAPGAGATAALILKHTPAGYTGIERDEQAAARVNSLDDNFRYRCIVGIAQQTHLAQNSAHVVLCEAFLAMQPDDVKAQVVAEAFRILRPGGRFGLHELSLRPDSLDPAAQQEVRAELLRSTQVSVFPLTSGDWCGLLKRAGFQITHQSETEMRILEPARIIKDESLLGAAKIAWNLTKSPVARKRVRAMRRTFRQQSDRLGAVAIVAVKPKRPALP